MPWDSESKGYYRNKVFFWELQQSLYFFEYSQNEILSSGKVVSSTGSFICAISIGTLIMELQALRQCVEGIITKIKVFWELQQSIYFIYATMNEDIYATLCVDCTQRICVKTKNKELYAYFICFMKKYVCKKYCTWYLKKKCFFYAWVSHLNWNLLKKLTAGTMRSELGTNLGMYQ